MNGLSKAHLLRRFVQIQLNLSRGGHGVKALCIEKAMQYLNGPFNRLPTQSMGGGVGYWNNMKGSANSG